MSKNNTNEQKIYVGSGKIVDSQYGPFRVVTLDCDELDKHKYVCPYTKKNRVNIIINDKKQTDQFGKNVSAIINDYKPEKKELENKGNDLPF